MTLPSCTTAMATPGTFHCFMASAARSSRPWSLAAPDPADATEPAGFFLEVWAKLGDAKNIADKNTTRAGFRMVFLSEVPNKFRIRCAGRPGPHVRATFETRSQRWVLPAAEASDSDGCLW